MLSALLLLNLLCLAVVLFAASRDSVLVDENGQSLVGPWQAHTVSAADPAEQTRV
jgi:hypothetical protein